MAATMHDLLTIMIERGASDLHITTGTPPQIRLHGKLTPLTQFERLTPQDTQRLAYSVLNEGQKQKFEEDNELDLSFGIQGLARSLQRLPPARRRRLRHPSHPDQDPHVRRARLPPSWSSSPTAQGPHPRHGAHRLGQVDDARAMVDKINNERTEHIMTIEDPIEFVHHHKKCLVNQREVFSTRSPSRTPSSTFSARTRTWCSW